MLSIEGGTGKRGSMKIVIDIPDEIYMDIKEEVRTKVNTFEHIPFLHEVISVGIPLPKGHGRLIDADELKKDMNTITEWNGDVHRFVSERGIDFASTIIEADKAESEVQDAAQARE